MGVEDRYDVAPANASELTLKASEMRNAFSSMEYPHWLMIAGAFLLVLGFIGLALRQRSPPELEEMATVEGPSESEPELVQSRADNRKAMLAEQARERWAQNKDRNTEEPLNDRSKVSEKEPK